MEAKTWFDAASRTIASNLPYDRVEWFDPQGRVLGKNGQNSAQQRIARVWRNDTFRVLRVQAD